MFLGELTGWFGSPNFLIKREDYKDAKCTWKKISLSKENEEKEKVLDELRFRGRLP